MANSIIKRPDGTSIEINGSPEEIKKILELYNDVNENISGKIIKLEDKKNIAKQTTEKQDLSEDVVIKIVQKIRSGDEAEKIGTNILDQSSQVDRVLLPLYIANDKHLTSGGIYLVLQQLGIKMSLPNISKTLSKTASKYVMPHSRKKRGGGGGVQYSLSHKGVKYFKSLLA